MRGLRMLDTFAGIGGFSYAATKLVGGYRTTQFIEIDPFCQKILKKHFPFTPIHDDIRTFTAIPGQYDVITGGFPCQDLSVAGQRRGITKESRSGLFYELIRVIRLVRPKFVVMENVAAILNNGLDIVLGELSEAGYDAEWSIISASSLGACHRRSRWWLVAYPNGFRCGGRSSEGCSVQERQILSGEQKGSEMGSEVKRCSSFSTDTNNNGSPTSSINGFDDKANSNTQERANQVSQSSRSIKSADSGVVQPSTESTYSNSNKRKTGDKQLQQQGEASIGSSFKLTNSHSKRLQRTNFSEMEREIWAKGSTRRLNPDWRSYVSKPILRRGDDGLSYRVDRTKALGNSVVPQVAAIPLKRVHDLYYNE